MNYISHIYAYITLQIRSSKPEPGFLEDILWFTRHFHLSQLIHLLFSAYDVDLFYGNRKRGAEIHLVSKVQRQEDRERDVRGEEIRDIEGARPKHLETVCQGEDGDNEQHKVRCVWLQRRSVGQRVKLAMVDKCLAEAEIGDHDDDPGDEAGDGGDVHEPVEDCGASVGDVKVCKKRKHPSEQDRNVRHTSSVRDAEELRRLVVQRHRV